MLVKNKHDGEMKEAQERIRALEEALKKSEEEALKKSEEEEAKKEVEALKKEMEAKDAAM